MSETKQDTIEVITNISNYIKELSEKTGKSQETVEEELLTRMFQESKLYQIHETVDGEGYATLENINIWGGAEGKPTTKGEETTTPQELQQEYRRLREEFAPVSAGIDYHLSFTLGNGLSPQVIKPNDPHQIDMRDIISLFNRSVYQDDYTYGLFQILNLMLDSSMVEGASAAEIVYGNINVDFKDYITSTTEVVVGKSSDGTDEKEERFVVKEPDWKKFTNGITRLKIIDGAVNRLEPVRDTKSFEVLYWVLDKNTKDAKYFHTWQIFWLPWNIRGTHLKGSSLVRKVYVIAKLLEQIQKNVGVNFQRWAEKKYFFICCAPWSEVWTEDGYKQIKDIVVGDKVWGRYGLSTVLETFKRPYSGDMVNIKTKYLDTVTFTPNHPIKVARKYRLRNGVGHRKYLVQFKEVEGYKRADEVTTDDWLIVPKTNFDKDVFVDFPTLEHAEGYGNGRNPTQIQSRPLDKDLARLFGWYLSEGSINSVNNYSVQFSLNINEKHYAEEIVTLIGKLGLKASISEKPETNSLQVVVCSKVLATFLDNWFGHGANNKHLPEHFLYWNTELITSLVSGVVDGDGSKRGNMIRLKLNSKTLIKQLQLALMKVGVVSGFYKVKRSPTEIRGKKIVGSDAYQINWVENRTVNISDEENYYFRVTSTTKTDYDGYVYNLHVDNENEYYLPFRTHNCGDAKRPWGRVNTANFLRDLKSMKENNLTAIPVPAGFDVKDIGGEIFEGSAVTEHLLGMIAAGMQYPKELIQTGKMNVSENEWLGWIVRQGHNQDAVARAVEQQLWRRHLYCVSGKTHRISRKGKLIENQDEEMTFIPKLVWKAEGHWARETKMKTLKLVGDMANPASDVLHFAMQKDMADTLGYGELDWTDTENYLKLQKEIKLVAGQIELLKSQATLKYLETIGLDKLVKVLEEQEAVNTLLGVKQEQENISGDKDSADVKEPKTKTKEEQLKTQQENRLTGGVNRSNKDTKNEKGMAKKSGEGPRLPKQK